MQTYTGTLHVITCGCGCKFGMDEALYRLRIKDGGYFWCPMGCKTYFRDDENTRLRAQLAREEGRAASLAYDLKHAENQRRAEKAAKTRLKNRIAKGVCPCCKRHFANVHRHITTQHPEFAMPSEPSGTPEGGD